MRIGSLFSGYGGLDLAVESVTGATPAWFCEYEAAPSKVLAAHWPSVPNLGDITAVDWSAVEPVDIVTGGSPCPDLSFAGRRAGMTEGTRSNLWVQMRECVAVLRPSLVIWENVRGAYSACAECDSDSELGPCPRCVDPDSGLPHAPNLRALGRVLGDLSDLGYDTQWRGLRAADVGAPHGRFRVFVVSHARGERGIERRQPAPGQAPSGWPFREPSGRGGASAADSSSDGRDEGRTESARLERGSDVAERGAATTDADCDGLAQLGRELVQQRDTDRRDSTDIAWGVYEPAIRRWERILGRPAPAPTEPGPRGRQRLSPRLVEWMMGLPAGWVTGIPGISRNDQLKMLGNGVVPQQAIAGIGPAFALERAA